MPLFLAYACVGLGSANYTKQRIFAVKTCNLKLELNLVNVYTFQVLIIINKCMQF